MEDETYIHTQEESKAARGGKGREVGWLVGRWIERESARNSGQEIRGDQQNRNTKKDIQQ